MFIHLDTRHNSLFIYFHKTMCSLFKKILISELMNQSLLRLINIMAIFTHNYYICPWSPLPLTHGN